MRSLNIGGKYGQQLPSNPSLSLTLSEANTKTCINYKPKEGSGLSSKFYFEGKINDAFGARINQYLETISPYFPFLNRLELEIHSENTFPHSSGIASSASAMSALALCVCSIEQKLSNEDIGDFYKKASYISRLGSGSACRSVYAGASLWGNVDHYPETSDLFAIPLNNQVHKLFLNFKDRILIVSKKEKSVSSSAGHQLMKNNPYASSRFKQATFNTKRLLEAMTKGDLDVFGEICESEALILHALMMSSSPGYLLLEPNSIEIIQKVRSYRKETNHPVYFTIDAGPNIHLLFPNEIAMEVDSFIQNELLHLCADKMVIKDHSGSGPIQLK